jgi:hypothetical protein
MSAVCCSVCDTYKQSAHRFRSASFAQCTCTNKPSHLLTQAYSLSLHAVQAASRYVSRYLISKKRGLELSRQQPMLSNPIYGVTPTCFTRATFRDDDSISSFQNLHRIHTSLRSSTYSQHTNGSDSSSPVFRWPRCAVVYDVGPRRESAHLSVLANARLT